MKRKMSEMEEGLKFINDQHEEHKSEVKEIRETLSELKLMPMNGHRTMERSSKKFSS